MSAEGDPVFTFSLPGVGSLPCSPVSYATVPSAKKGLVLSRC